MKKMSRPLPEVKDTDQGNQNWPQKAVTTRQFLFLTGRVFTGRDDWCPSLRANSRSGADELCSGSKDTRWPGHFFIDLVVRNEPGQTRNVSRIQLEQALDSVHFVH